MPDDKKKGAGLRLTRNPFTPRSQGVTLEPAPDMVRVHQSIRPGNIVLLGYTRVDPDGERRDAIVIVDVPREMADDAHALVQRVIAAHGVTDDRQHRADLSLAPGGLLS